MEKMSQIDPKLLKFFGSSVCSKRYDHKEKYDINFTYVSKNHTTANDPGLWQLSSWTFVKDMLTVLNKDTIIFNRTRYYAHINVNT